MTLKQQVEKEEKEILNVLSVNETVEEILDGFNASIDAMSEPDWAAEPEQ